MMTFLQEILTFAFLGNWPDWLFHWQKNPKKFTFKNQHMTGNFYDPVEFNDRKPKNSTIQNIEVNALQKWLQKIVFELS